MKTINIFTENIFDGWEVNEKDVIQKTREMLEHYIQTLGDRSCLFEKEYQTITLDIVFCDSAKTDDENSFIFDGDINLGEIVIALDKVISGDNRDISLSKNKEQELFF